MGGGEHLGALGDQRVPAPLMNPAAVAAIGALPQCDLMGEFLAHDHAPVLREAEGDLAGGVPWIGGGRGDEGDAGRKGEQ